jgi:hypothetical protein
METWHTNGQPTDLLPMVKNIKAGRQPLKDNIFGLKVRLGRKSVGGKSLL